MSTENGTNKSTTVPNLLQTNFLPADPHGDPWRRTPWYAVLVTGPNAAGNATVYYKAVGRTLTSALKLAARRSTARWSSSTWEPEDDIDAIRRGHRPAP